MGESERVLSAIEYQSR